MPRTTQTSIALEILLGSVKCLDIENVWCCLVFWPVLNMCSVLIFPFKEMFHIEYVRGHILRTFFWGGGGGGGGGGKVHVRGVGGPFFVVLFYLVTFFFSPPVVDKVAQFRVLILLVPHHRLAP